MDEIDWPEKGDRLFNDNVGHYSACVNWGHGRGKQSLYAKSFGDASVRLIEHLVNTRSELDTLIYPVIFCFRHSLELTLKNLIHDGINLCENLEISEVPKTHDLLQLWHLVKKILIELFPDDDRTLLSHVELCIKEVDIVDKYSMSFRYPEDKNGTPHLENMRNIDTKNLMKTIKALLNFFSGVDSMVSVAEEHIMEMRAEMRGY